MIPAFETLSSYSEIVAYYERHHPGQLRGFMPEYQIEEPTSYWPVKTFAVGAMLAWDGLKNDRENVSMKIYCWASLLALSCQTPTFFVTPQLVGAALRTELPGDLDLSRLGWPFPLLVFMLPRGIVRHPVEGDAPFVCIGLTPSKFGLPGHPEPSIQLSYPHLLTVTMMPQSDPVQLYHTNVVVTPGITLDQAKTQISIDKFYLGPDPVLLETTTDSIILDSSKFGVGLWKLGLTILSLMAANPELVEYGPKLKMVKSKHPGQVPKQWYGPNIIGRLYRTQVKRDGALIRGGSKRPHWVRGHLKNQPYGTKHALRKLIWIQPYRTGIEEITGKS
jgi:hypothetical protein